MANEKWFITLEAYLDEELSAEETKTFEADLATDEEKQGHVETRRRERTQYRDLLLDDVDGRILQGDLTQPKVGSGHWNKKVLGIVAAMAASVCLVILVPWLSRDENGVEGPHSLITRSGQVVAVRFGETPYVTAKLETGAVDYPGGPGRSMEDEK